MTLTSSLSIANRAGTLSVDFSKMNPDFTLTVNNPLIDFAKPTDDVPVTGSATFNVVAINIGFLSNGITISATEEGGLGSLYTTTRTTTFEKLFYLTYFDKSYKNFYLNDTDPIPVSITNYRAHVGTGKKDIVDHTLSLMITTTEGT